MFGMRGSRRTGKREQDRSVHGTPRVRRTRMLRQDVDSSELRSVGYKVDAAVLEAEFHSGDVYHYFDVPAELVVELLEAESIGRYFNVHIRSKFRFKQVR
jgi:KTSC domain